MIEIYLDNNATTQPHPEVCAVVAHALSQEWGNPSSAHGRGEGARDLLEQAREQAAVLISASPEDLTFTSGGTEANNTVIWGSLRSDRRIKIAVSTVEHSSVLSCIDAIPPSLLDAVSIPVDRSGHLDVDCLHDLLRSGLDLVSVQWANGETGVIQPVEQIAALCRQYGARYHVDAAQAVGRLPISVTDVGADYLSYSAHKIHGPKGVGALWVRPGRRLRPLIQGGEQERRRRGGTQNVHGIAGLGVAACLRTARLTEVTERLLQLRSAFELRLRRAVPDATVISELQNRVCNTSAVRFPCADGQALVAQLDAHGLRCSQTSACTSARPEPSRVLRAMGATESEAYETLRFAFSEYNSISEVDAAVDLLAGIYGTLRSAKRSLLTR